MSSIKTQTLKGFRDFLPAEARKRQYVIDILKKVFEEYGFEPLETPALEYAEILRGKYGEEEKLIYEFKTRGGDEVALRYDQTVPLARVIAQYPNLPKPFKRYQTQPVWRGENPQKGRYREFLQCDIDTVGTASVFADAEIITVTVKSLQELGFKNFKILINDRNIFSALVTRIAISEKELPKVTRIIDKLKKIGREGVVNELIKAGFSDDEARYFLQAVETSPLTSTLNQIFQFLEGLGVDKSYYQFSPTLARGLDYYTGTIFEVEIEGYEGGSIGGGGRYDNLIGMFAGKQIPAVGFSFGFDRLMEAMDELNLFPLITTSAKVLVTVFSPELLDKSLETANKLRSQNINTELWLEPEAKLEKQLKYADQKGIPFVAIIGPQEKVTGKVTVRDLTNKTQETLTLDETIQKLTHWRHPERA